MQPQPFSLAFSQPLAEKPFCVGAANEVAVSWIHRWPHWPQRGLYLYGPASCGKTHLAGQWAQKSGAFWITGRDVDEDFLARLPHSPEKAFVVDNVHQVAQESRLFHLLNSLSQKNVFFLLTDTSSPTQLPFTLPDLTSRLRALPNVAMLEPDDDLLQKTLASHFSARGLHVGHEVLAYLHPRIHRSFQGLYDVVDRLDQASLSYQKEISIPFVRETLGF